MTCPHHLPIKGHPYEEETRGATPCQEVNGRLTTVFDPEHLEVLARQNALSTSQQQIERSGTLSN